MTLEESGDGAKEGAGPWEDEIRRTKEFYGAVGTEIRKTVSPVVVTADANATTMTGTVEDGEQVVGHPETVVATANQHSGPGEDSEGDGVEVLQCKSVDIDSDDLDDIQLNNGETITHPLSAMEEEEEEVPHLDSEAAVNVVLSTQAEMAARDEEMIAVIQGLVTAASQE